MNILQKLSKHVFFQDWLPNYGIYRDLFPIFDSISLPFFEIGIILKHAIEVSIYSTFNLKISPILKDIILKYVFIIIFLMPNFRKTSIPGSNSKVTLKQLVGKRCKCTITLTLEGGIQTKVDS